MIYLFIYSTFFIYSILEGIVRNRVFFKISSIFLSIFLLFIMAYRGRVGRDYYEYIRLYYEGGGLVFLGFPEVEPLGLYFEPLFVLLNKVLFSMGGSIPFVLFVYFLITLSLISSSIRKYSPYFFISFLLYLSHDFLLKELIQIRFGMASAIFLFSLSYLNNNNYFRFSIFTIISSLIHSASLVGFVFMFFWRYRYLIYDNFKLVIFSSFLISFLPLVYIFDFFSLFFPRIDNFLSNDRYSGSSIFTLLTLLKQSFWTYIFYHFRFSLRKCKYFEVLFASYIFSTIFLLIFHEAGSITNRIAAYFSITEFVLIPTLLVLQRSLKNKFILLAILGLYAVTIAYFNIVLRHVVSDFYLVF